MMGGGFGGCTINLVRRAGADAFEAAMKTAYQDEFAIDLPCYRVNITEGTTELVS